MNTTVNGNNHTSSPIHNHQHGPNNTTTTTTTPSSFRDPELDPKHWGYRVVFPTASSSSSSSSSSSHNNHRRSNRTYATSSYTSASINYSEDYDDYTLFAGPSENAHCDLGATVVSTTTTTTGGGGGGEENSFHTILQFDDAGLVRPIWEQTGSVLLQVPEDNNNNNNDDDDDDSSRDHSSSPGHQGVVGTTMQSHRQQQS